MQTQLGKEPLNYSVVRLVAVQQCIKLTVHVASDPMPKLVRRVGQNRLLPGFTYASRCPNRVSEGMKAARVAPGSKPGLGRFESL